MSVSENLKKHVAEKNLPNIRGDLASCIIGDQNMSKIFDESFRYVLSHGISEAELFEADNGKEFETEPTEENFHSLRGLLSVNFSQKKLEALKKIGRTLDPLPTEEKKSPEPPARRLPQQESKPNWKLIAAVAAAIGILLVAGVLAMGKNGG